MSLRKAINEKCKDCIYDECSGLGTWKEQIAQCTSLSCPLWGHRAFPASGPFSRKEGFGDAESVLRAAGLDPATARGTQYIASTAQQQLDQE